MAHFDVVGDLDGDLEGDLEGDVMGDVMGDEVVGIVKHNPRTGQRRIVPARQQQRSMALPAKPNWRQNQMAPGVIRPEEGMVVLPMTPTAGNGIFTFGGVTSITWEGQLQKPFRAERLMCSVVRSQTTATARLLGQLFVGTDLQQAEIAGWDIELVGQATAFGTRLTCKPAEPGVMLRLIVNLSQALTVTGDSIAPNVLFLGRVIA